MAEEVQEVLPTPPPKFSRYRSVRYPKGKLADQPPEIPQLPPQSADKVNKQSTSRYRSKSIVQPAVPAPSPQEPASRARHAPSPSTSKAHEEAFAILTSRERRVGRQFEIPELPIRSRESSGNGPLEQPDRSLGIQENPTSTHPLRQHAPHVKEATNLTPFEPRLRVSKDAPQQQSAERRLPDRKTNPQTSTEQGKSENRERTRRGSIGQAPQPGLKQEIYKGRQINQQVKAETPESSKQRLQSSVRGRYKSIFGSKAGVSGALPMPVTDVKEMEGKEPHVPGILFGGGGIVHGIDAPASAINAGEHRVKVKCGHSSLILPVTVSTTCADILYSAARLLPKKVDVDTSVLLESYKDLGLERPIRRYEHIRDVLNSWDHDENNTLLIVPSANGDIDEDLDIQGVPAKQPGDTTFQLYYSQKPGTWDKRAITLRADGQVLMAKGIGREAKNLCHISDFDIYIPTPKHVVKVIKPPKKHCFAMKSQYKSSIFLSTENFVHFFCTKDQNIAAAWYKAAQGWRTWHLVKVMGKGREANAPDVAADCDNRRSMDTLRPHDKASVTSPYLLGSFEHSIRDDEYEKINGSPPAPPPPKHHVNTAAMHATQKMNRPKKAPPVSFPRGFREDDDFKTQQYNTLAAQTPVLPNTLPDDVPLGMLARTQTLNQRTGSPKKGKEANLNGHEGTNSFRGHGRALSVRSTRTSGGGLGRTPSQRQPQKPLIDLTPEYREPLQHVKKGRGIIPQQMPAGGLIEIATTPEIAIPVPPATAWQRPLPGTVRPGTSGGARPGTSSGDNVHAQQAGRQRSGTVHESLPQR